MSIKGTSSIFSREFRRQFNANKYQNFTERVHSNNTHLSHFSINDLKIGRFIFYFGITCYGLTIWRDPGFIHEAIGHLPPPPKYDLIDYNLSGQGRKLNQKLITREHKEHKLHQFMDTITEYE